MAKKRSPEKTSSAGTPRKNTPIDELDQEGSLMHYNAVMMEEMNSKLKLALEFMTVLAEQVKTQFEQVNAQIKQLSEQVNAQIKQLSEQVNAQIKQLSEQMELQFEQLNKRMDQLEQRMDISEIAQQGIRTDMLDMEQRICSKINRITERCERHESRLTALESRS